MEIRSSIASFVEGFAAGRACLSPAAPLSIDVTIASRPYQLSIWHRQEVSVAYIDGEIQLLVLVRKGFDPSAVELSRDDHEPSPAPSVRSPLSEDDCSVYIHDRACLCQYNHMMAVFCGRWLLGASFFCTSCLALQAAVGTHSWLNAARLHLT
jgi:hypothetical protein